MGQGSSKSKKQSYNVAKDFTFEKKKDEIIRTTTTKTTTPVPDVIVENVVTEELETPKLSAAAAVVPDWITEELFVSAIKSSVDGFVKVKQFSVKPAMSAGENYSTLMLRVGIDAELKNNITKHISYMLKVSHDTPEMQQWLSINNIFDTEALVYFDLIPQFEQLYKTKGLELTFGAKFFKVDDAERQLFTILLEDLGQYGYKNANRLEGLNEQHTLAVLKLMAQFHAASAYYYATKGSFPDIMMRGLLHEDNPMAKIMLEKMMGSFQNMFLANLNQYENGESYYKPKFEKFFDRMYEEFIALGQSSPDDFAVLNHGDCWCNNVLFKYDTKGDLSDARFVDFQMPKFGSPAQDLYYFLITSVTKDIKLKKFDYFIRYYFDNLEEHLKLLEYPKELPTLRELHRQLFKFGSWAVTSMIITMPVVLMDPTEKATMENFMSDEKSGLNFKNLLYTNKRYCGYVEIILPWLDNRGLLDIQVHKKINKTTPLENDNVKVEYALKKLANLHAISAHYYATNTSSQDSSNTLKETYIDDDKKFQILKVLKSYENTGEYIQKLEKLMENFNELLQKAKNYNENTFNVLNNNIECNQTDNSALQIYIPDLKRPHFGAPAHDLYKLLLTSPNLSLKIEKFDYFIHYYHEQLKQNLDKLQSSKKVINLKEFHVEMLENGSWAILTVLGSLLEDDQKNECRKEEIRQIVEIALPWMDQRGLLD